MTVKFCSRLKGAGICRTDSCIDSPEKIRVCCECPYNHCVYDDVDCTMINRQYQARELKDKGWNAKQIALKLGVCKQHVYRLIGNRNLDYRADI